MQLHRDLNDEEKEFFRKWARENYTPHEPIDGTWHPVVQAECAAINAHKQMAVTPAVNNYICPHCKNDRCSKAEGTCWKCGEKL